MVIFTFFSFTLFWYPSLLRRKDQLVCSFYTSLIHWQGWIQKIQKGLVKFSFTWSSHVIEKRNKLVPYSSLLFSLYTAAAPRSRAPPPPPTPTSQPACLCTGYPTPIFPPCAWCQRCSTLKPTIFAIPKVIIISPPKKFVNWSNSCALIMRIVVSFRPVS